MNTIIKSLVLFIATVVAFPAVSQVCLDPMGLPSIETYKNYPATSNTSGLKTASDIQVIRSFPSPISLPSGIASDGQCLWICGYNEYKLFKVCPTTGTVLQTLPITIQRPYGITLNNDTIYLLDNTSKNIFAINKIDGSCIDTIIPQNFHPGIIFPTGLYLLNNEFVFNENKGPQSSYTGDSIYFSDINNSYLQGIPSFGTFSSGIAYDGRYLWINDNPSQTSNRIDPMSWQVVETIKTPGGIYPNGIAFDGTDMWIINNQSDSIYMFTPSVITNVPENKKEDMISIYPNPAHDQFNIQLNHSSVENVAIFSADGRLITMINITPFNQSIHFNTNEGDLSKGVYFVSVTGKGIYETHKLIVK